MMIKRIFDTVLSFAGLVLLFPLFLAIGLWIKLDSPGPVFFRQERVGRFGRRFRIHKFRSMADNAQGLQITAGDDVRITRSGRWLRKYKLDEFPQLIDVLVGNMSLVGPRPEVPRYIREYPSDVRERILSVRPGITDFASIEYRNENEILRRSTAPERDYIEKILPAKIAFYERYVRERSFFLDVKLIFCTLIVTFGANASPGSPGQISR